MNCCVGQATDIIFLLRRGRVSGLSIPRWRSAALDRLLEKQRPEGGALAHADQRTSWIYFLKAKRNGHLSSQILIGCPSLPVSDKGLWVTSIRRRCLQWSSDHQKSEWFPFSCGRTWNETEEQLFNHLSFNSFNLWVWLATCYALTIFSDLQNSDPEA